MFLNLCVLSLRSPKRQEAAAARARFISRDGDHVTLLAVFRMYQQVRSVRGIPGISSDSCCT